MKKRVLSLLLVVVMAVALVPMAPAAPLETAAADYYFKGDFDGDGEITTSDARMVLQACVGKYGDDGDIGVDFLLPYEFNAANVDGDTEVTTTDARLILQYVVGKIPNFPDPNAYTANTFSPVDKEAGSSFADLADVEENAPGEVTDSTKQFGLFALTAEANEGLPFNVACYVGKDQVSALLPAGVDVTALVPTFTYYGDTVTLNGQPVVSDVTALDLTAPVTLTLTARDGSTKKMKLVVETLNTGLPSMAVTMEDFSGADGIEKETYSNATFYLGGGDPDKCDYAAAESVLIAGAIKGRGNSSWLLDEKKSYTVKLNEKAQLLDLSESKDWAIVANYEDRSLLRNVIAGYYAEASGIPYVMKIRPVDMWIDGQYWGTYNLTEKIEIEKDRVNITDIKKPDNEAFEDLAADKVGYLLEFDAHVTEKNAGGKLENVQSFNPEDVWKDWGWGRWEYTYTDVYDDNQEKTGIVYYNPETDETFFRVPYNGKWATIKNPSTENLEHNPAMREYIFQKVMELDCALRARNRNPERVSQLLDLKSFAQWVIVEELMDNTDASFHSSVYMSIDVGGKFVFGPLWDFDRSSGNCSYWHNSVGSLIGSNWGRYAFETEDGRAALQEAWMEFKQNTAKWEQAFDDYAKLIEDSSKANFERWEILGKEILYNPENLNGIDSIAGQVDFLKNWLKNRYAELDSYISLR